MIHDPQTPAQGFRLRRRAVRHLPGEMSFCDRAKATFWADALPTARRFFGSSLRARTRVGVLTVSDLHRLFVITRRNNSISIKFFVTQPTCEGKFIGRGGRAARTLLNGPTFSTDGSGTFPIIAIFPTSLTANTCARRLRESISERSARQFTIKASSTAVRQMRLPLPFSLTE